MSALLKHPKAPVDVFQFLNDITLHKKYILNEDNVHGYNKFTITRFLSLRSEYHKVVDILNKYQGVLDAYEFHRLATNIIYPKKEYRMNKGDKLNFKTDISLVSDQVDLISEYFKITPKEAYGYYKLGGEELVKNIKILYGIVTVD